MLFNDGNAVFSDPVVYDVNGGPRAISAADLCPAFLASIADWLSTGQVGEAA